MYLSSLAVKAVVRSKAAVLLLLIYCFFGGSVLVFVFGMHYFVSFLASFAIILTRKRERAGCFDFIVFSVAWYC